MRVKRSVLGLLGIVALMLTSVLAAGPAQAAAPSNHGAGTRVVLTAPPAPSAGLSPSAAAAVDPTISPSVIPVHLNTGDVYTCYSGSLCAEVWDYKTGDWAVFHLTRCVTYALSNWEGTGYVLDRQTGNVPTYFLNQSHATLTPPGGSAPGPLYPSTTKYAYNWTPVWYIDLC